MTFIVRALITSLFFLSVSLSFSQPKTESFDFTDTEKTLSGVFDLEEKGILVCFSIGSGAYMEKVGMDVQRYSKEMDLLWKAELDLRWHGVHNVFVSLTSRYTYIWNTVFPNSILIAQVDNEGALRQLKFDRTLKDARILRMLNIDDKMYLLQYKRPREAEGKDYELFIQELEENSFKLIGTTKKLNLPLTDPAIHDNRRWYYLTTQNGQMYFYHRYVTVKSREVENTIKYEFASVAPNGELIDTWTIPILLSDGKFVAGMKHSKTEQGSSTSPIFKTSDLGHVFYDEANDQMYIYGVYHTVPGGSKTNNESEGYFVRKYAMSNSKAEELWKIQEPFPAVFKETSKYFGTYKVNRTSREILHNHLDRIQFRQQYTRGAKGYDFHWTIGPTNGQVYKSRTSIYEPFKYAQKTWSYYKSPVYHIEALRYYTNEEINAHAESNFMPGPAFGKMYELNKAENAESKIIYITKHSSTGDIVIQNKVEDRTVNMYYLPSMD